MRAAADDSSAVQAKFIAESNDAAGSNSGALAHPLTAVNAPAEVNLVAEIAKASDAAAADVESRDTTPTNQAVAEAVSSPALLIDYWLLAQVVTTSFLCLVAAQVFFRFFADSLKMKPSNHLLVRSNVVILN
jgi:hypothetical protein